MSITSLYSTSSSGSSRKSSLDRSASRKLSIELIPNQAIFRETFIGSPAFRGMSSSSEEDAGGLLSPTAHSGSLSAYTCRNSGCSACQAMTTAPAIVRKGGLKRHAVLLPTRHHGMNCNMSPPPTGELPALPSIGEDSFVEWERRGSRAIAHNIPSPSPSSPIYSPSSSRKGQGDYFTLRPVPSSTLSLFPPASPSSSSVPRTLPALNLGSRFSIEVTDSVNADLAYGIVRPPTPITPIR